MNAKKELKVRNLSYLVAESINPKFNLLFNTLLSY